MILLDMCGVLLSSQNFDAGQCYQINSGNLSRQRQRQFPHTTNALMGADLWCQHDIQLPTDTSSSQPYTLYWVWDWPTAPGVCQNVPNGKQELYTTCMDVDIVFGDGISDMANSGFIAGQDLNSAAVSSELGLYGESFSGKQLVTSATTFHPSVTISGILGIPLVNLTGCEIRFIFWLLRA